MKLCLLVVILTSLITGAESCVDLWDACENGGQCVDGACDCTDTGLTGVKCNDEWTFGISRSPDDDTVDEGSTPVLLTITRPPDKSNYAVTLVGMVVGGATPDDYVIEDAVFNVGDTSIQITMTILDDDLFEDDEEFSLDVAEHGSSIPLSTAPLRFIIPTNDPLTITDSRAGPFMESDGAVPLLFFVISQSQDPIDIVLTITSTDALEGTDYTVASSTINFNTNNWIAMLAAPITFLSDTTPEPHKSITFTFTSSVPLNGDTAKTIALMDDDDETMVVSGPSTVTEDGGIASFTLDRGMAPTRAAKVSYTVTSNRPALSTDSKKITEVLSKVELNFPIGGPSMLQFSVTLEDDTVKEPDQTFTIDFFIEFRMVVPIPSMTVTVTEDDDYQLTITPGPATEGVPILVTLLRNSFLGELEVTVTSVDGTAIAGTHFVAVNEVVTFQDTFNTMEIAISILNDEFFNFDRKFSLMATSTAAMDPFTPVEVTISDNDKYGVTVESANVLEGAPIMVTLTRDSTEGELVVAISTADGTAIAGEDYTALTATAIFADGSDGPVVLQIETMSDNDYELDESLSLSVTGSGYTLKNDITVTFDILNDDVEVLTLIVDTTVSESVGFLVATLTRTQSFEDLSVVVNKKDETVDGSDVALRTAGSLSFGSNPSLKIVISIIEDVIAEFDETFVLTVDAPDPIVDVSATITILDDDPDTISVDTFLGAAENIGTKIVTLSRTVSMAELTVAVEATDDTAKEGSDFTIDSEATFEAGSLQATFAVTIIDDDIEEDAVEVFSITISGSSSEVTGDVNADFKIADNEGSRPFDCRRKNQDCESNVDKCYNDYPFCDCVGGDTREGAMCNIVTDQKDGAGCPATCTENGQCLSDGGVVSCACKPGYFGDNCENYFLKPECSPTSMKFIVNPHGNFDGVIYVKEKLSESSCQGVDGADGFTIEVDHDSSACGEILPVEGVSETSYSRKFIVQYDKSILTQLDQCVTVSCKFDTDNVLVDTGVVTVDPNGPLTEESTSGLFSPVTLQILDIKGVPVTESMVVPISKKLCVTLSIPSAFGGLEMIDIEFNNTREDEPKTLLVLSEGCETNTAKFVFANRPFYVTPSNKKVIRFCFFAFKFVNIELLAVTMKVKICVDPDDCVATSCSPLRRKREAGGDTRTETLGTRFTISNSPQQSSSNQNVSEVETSTVRTETTCEFPSHYLPTIIGLGVLVLLLVLLVLYLTYRLARRSKRTLHPLKHQPWFRHYPTPFTPK